MSIGIAELADEFNVTYRTLRFYEAKGILSPERQGNRRLFSASDRHALMAVLKAKQLGFTLEEAANLLHDNGQLALTAEQIAAQLTHLQRIHREAAQAIEELQAA